VSIGRILLKNLEHVKKQMKNPDRKAASQSGQAAKKAGQAPLEHLTLEMLIYGRQKPAFSHFVARILKKILAEQLTRFIR